MAVVFCHHPMQEIPEKLWKRLDSTHKQTGVKASQCENIFTFVAIIILLCTRFVRCLKKADYSVSIVILRTSTAVKMESYIACVKLL